MKRFILIFITLILLGTWKGGIAMAFSIMSPSFDAGGSISQKFTCDGPDLSPALKWTDPPAGTKSFAIIADDPDAPVGTWVHWVVYNLPADARELAEGMPASETLPNGAKQGMTDFRRVGYGGPCPPKGPAHRYFFKLYALDGMMNLPPKATKADLEKAMKGHILAETELMGKYGR
jgi:Raf kinase inhibitor-like YbhB/YbcL family protein